jgi:hypothetical protein
MSADNPIATEPDPFTMRQFPELVVGAFVVWLLVMAWLGVSL